MKEGRYFRVPEGPDDMVQLWSQAAPLKEEALPAWLTPEDAPHYRRVAARPQRPLTIAERAGYAAELEDLAEVGIIVEDDPADPGEHRVFLEAPPCDEIWSIGIYEGCSPCELSPHPEARNPVLTRAHVTDIPASFVADPFLVRHANRWTMFFEVMNWRSGKGEIALATSDDGLRWTYEQVVLAEPFHLSYPYVFTWRNEHYLVPESFQSGTVRLYRATSYPSQWECVGTLLDGPYLVDATLFPYADRWWLFVDASIREQHDTLRLFSASEPVGPWHEHPASPIVQGDPQRARPAGRVISWNGHLIRFAQGCMPHYGTDVRAFEILELTSSHYRERPLGIALMHGPKPAAWHAGGMHHVDAHCLAEGKWLAAVDGWFLPAPLAETHRL